MEIDDAKFKKIIDSIHSDYMAAVINRVIYEYGNGKVDEDGDEEDDEPLFMTSPDNVAEYRAEANALSCVRNRIIACGIPWPAEYLLEESKVSGCKTPDDIRECGLHTVDLEEIFPELFGEDEEDDEEESSFVFKPGSHSDDDGQELF